MYNSPIKIMKVIDLLRLERESLKVMSDCGLKVEDYGYIAMYDEYRDRRYARKRAFLLCDKDV